MTDPAPVDGSTLRELFTTRPAEFVAARNALVKERRASGERAAAAAIAALRRPSVPDWALNVVAVDHPEPVRDFLVAATQLRDRLEGRNDGDVRSALRDMRAAAAFVADLAEDVVAPASQAAAITARLAEVAGSAEAADQLAAGHLGSAALEAPDPFAGLTPSPARTRPSPRPPEEAKAAKAAKATKAAVDVAARREAEQALGTARREEASARSEARTASGRVDKAERAVGAAEARLEQARAAQRAADAEVERTTAAVAAAQEALARLAP